jgi:hypothetical protein
LKRRTQFAENLNHTHNLNLITKKISAAGAFLEDHNIKAIGRQ